MQLISNCGLDYDSEIHSQSSFIQFGVLFHLKAANYVESSNFWTTIITLFLSGKLLRIILGVGLSVNIMS